MSENPVSLQILIERHCNDTRACIRMHLDNRIALNFRGRKFS